MTELTTRQFIIISLFLVTTSKLMTMPISIFTTAQNDAIFAILFGSLIELGLITLICFVIAKNPNTNLFSLLKNRLGNVIAYIFVFLLYAFMITKFIFVLIEIFTFFKDYLYDDFNPAIYTLSTFFVVGYISYKGCRTMGRTFEILFPIIVIGLVIALVCNVDFITLNSMLPYFDEGVLPTLKGLGENLFYFGNALPLLFFVGKVRINSHFVSKTTCANAGLFAFILLFCFAFYDIFGYSTILSTFAISDYTQYDPYILDLQRLNWLSMMIDITKLFCSASVLLYCLGQALKSVIHMRASFVPILITLAVQFCLAGVINFSLHDSQTIISTYLSYITGGLIAVVMIVCIVLSIKRRAKCKNEFSTK